MQHSVGEQRWPRARGQRARAWVNAHAAPALLRLGPALSRHGRHAVVRMPHTVVPAPQLTLRACASACMQARAQACKPKLLPLSGGTGVAHLVIGVNTLRV